MSKDDLAAARDGFLTAWNTYQAAWSGVSDGEYSNAPLLTPSFSAFDDHPGRRGLYRGRFRYI